MSFPAHGQRERLVVDHLALTLPSESESGRTALGPPAVDCAGFSWMRLECSAPISSHILWPRRVDRQLDEGLASGNRIVNVPDSRCTTRFT